MSIELLQIIRRALIMIVKQLDKEIERLTASDSLDVSEQKPQ